MKTLLLPIVLISAMTVKAEIAFTSLFQPFEGGIGDVQTPNEYEGLGVPFRTGAGEYQIDAVTLDHYNFNNPSAGPVLIQLYKDSADPFARATDAVLLGSLSYAGVDPRDTRWPGQTTFFRYEPDSALTLDPSTDYYLFITSGPSVTADLLTFFPTPDRTATLTDWTFRPHFAGNREWYMGAAEVAFELEVTIQGEQPGTSVPDGGSTVLLSLIGCASLAFLRASRKQS